MQITLSQQLSHFRNHPSKLLCDRMIARSIIKLIQRQPFYGILLAKLPRTISHRLNSAFGITWLHKRIAMLYNPQIIANRVKTGSELLFWLQHEALHLIYLHPVRYPSNLITQMATDLTVNQMIPTKIPHELTLNRINQKWDLHLPSRVNSQLYVDQLTKFFRRNHHHDHDRQITNQQIRKILAGSDDHHFWGNEPRLSKQSKAVQLKRLLQRSYQSTPAKARGTLPGKVRSQLKSIATPREINWKAYLKQGLDGIAFGQQPSRARFNRRQAYRMDLMGTVSNYLQPVSIFVDNSGSMGDAEISYLLGQIGQFLKHFPINVDVYDFDSRVHKTAHYRAHSSRQIRFVRIGGGGTRFQSIFDYCQCQLQNKRNRLIIILTDGYGESHLNYYGFNNLLWILTRPKRDFSVRNLRGHVVSLFNEPALRNLEKR